MPAGLVLLALVGMILATPQVCRSGNTPVQQRRWTRAIVALSVLIIVVSGISYLAGVGMYAAI